MSDSQKIVNIPITLDQLLPGDILTFKGDKKDWASNFIMKLTNSEVSHEAIFVQKKDFVIAESRENGLHAHTLIANENGSCEVYVLRHNSANEEDREALSEIAKKYVTQQLSYPFSDLILLGLTLVFKKMPQEKLWGIAGEALEFLLLIGAELKKMIDDKKGVDVHAMICSSFVYQCYLDAAQKRGNQALELVVENGDAGLDEPLLQADNAKTKQISLIDLYEKYAGQDSLGTPNEFCFANVSPRFGLNPMKLWNALKDIVDALKALAKCSNITWSELKKCLIKFQSMYVTPNDLLHHLENATYIGTLKVDRGKGEYDDHFKK